jgi:ATP-dependent DNA helicase recQ
MERKYQILNQYFGYSSFRSGQEELIDAQMAGRDAVGIMPTGGGKSLCYQIPALLSDGITLVVSPLISLMKDQVAALKKAGIPAAYINSSLSIDQIRTVYKNLVANKYKIVYIAPERLLTEGFLLTVKSIKVSIVAVDEAHCISQWGQDFRPSYLRIVGFLKLLGYRPVVSAFTATATPQVRNDIERILELNDPLRVVTGFDRPNLHFEVLKPRNKPATLLELIKNRQDKSGIVYCSTRREVEKTCLMLQNNDILATRYHAGLSDDERRANQDNFVHDRCNVIVATNAFGMGIDKSNVAYVIHYNMPQSIEAYYQEAGRAGRDGSDAECILLYSAEDIRTAKYLIEHPVPNEEIPEKQRKQVAEQGLLRLDKMIGYCKTTNCLRGYILDYFGEHHRKTCDNCGNCSMVITEKDITTQAEMILSCIKRIQNHLGYSVGITILIRVLRGSRDRRILDLGLDALSTYGLMKNISRVELRELIENLETEGYVYKNPTNETIILTERSGDVLFRSKKAKIFMRTPSKTNERRADDLKVDEGLFEALKALRLRIATNEKVPAYIVFSNSTLQDMASKKPTTMTEFLDVSGVGKYKAEQYGEMFLTEIKRYKDGDYYDGSGTN